MWQRTLSFIVHTIYCKELYKGNISNRSIDQEMTNAKILFFEYFCSKRIKKKKNPPLIVLCVISCNTQIKLYIAMVTVLTQMGWV